MDNGINFEDLVCVLMILNVGAIWIVDWFKNSVQDIPAFKVEDWSNLTEFLKEVKTYFFSLFD